jgi:predicted ABC-type ATPase
VPEEDVRRRYRTGLRNFFELYRPLARDWLVLDNSLASAPRPVAAGEGADTSAVYDEACWTRIREEGGCDEA